MSTLDVYMNPFSRIERISRKCFVDSQLYKDNESLVYLLYARKNEDVLITLGKNLLSEKLPSLIKVIYEKQGSPNSDRAIITPQSKGGVKIRIDDIYRGETTEIVITKTGQVTTSFF